jgi:hypothetical protein
MNPLKGVPKSHIRQKPKRKTRYQTYKDIRAYCSNSKSYYSPDPISDRRKIVSSQSICHKRDKKYIEKYNLSLKYPDTKKREKKLEQEK